MKPLYSLIFFLFFYSYNFSQTYEIKYHTFISGIHGDISEIYEMKSEEELAKLKKESIKQILLYADGTSYFSMAENAKNEKIDEETDQKISSTVYSPTPVYKNQSESLFIINFDDTFEDLTDEILIIKNKLPDYKWKILDTQKKISGYNARLAMAESIRGEPIYAWYTEEISISDGPSEYCGLPGLILQLKQAEKTLYIIDSIKKIENKIEIEKPSLKGKVMSIEEFKGHVRELTKPRTIVRPDGSVITISGE